MGSVVAKAASGVGDALGNVILAPVKAIFGATCEGICSGTWDITCFIEHLCISSLLRLFLALVLTYIIMLFIYVLFQVGIIQCIGRNTCKMTWAACHAYWNALEQVGWFCWDKIKNTKRVYRRRRRFEDMEEGYGSGDYSSSSDEDYAWRHSKMRSHRSIRERRKDQMRKYLYPVRQSSKRSRKHGSGRHHHLRVRTSEVSVHVKGTGRARSSTRLQLAKRSHTNAKRLFKRRGIL